MTNKKEKLQEFIEGMEEILDEKAKEKYRDDYEDTEESTFVKGIEDQLDKLKFGGSVAYKKRRLKHIGNFAYLAFSKL